MVAADGESVDDVRRLAGALESASEHPIGRAIAAAGGELPVVEDFANVEGLGVHGIVEGHAVVVGRPRLLEDWSQHLPPELLALVERAQGQGRTPVAVGWDGRARGVITVGDTIKPGEARRRGGS